MKRVQVLLSAYNGELYIAEQLKSIMDQSWFQVTVLVRDDGSTDGTVDIVKRVTVEYRGRVELIQGSNLGVVGSFFELLAKSDSQADYYCFCDQDDVWFSHKVESAVARLESNRNRAQPAMVFTSTQLTDGELNPKGIWPNPPSREPSFYNALVQNIAVGATMTFNQELRNRFVLNRKPDVQKVLMHDWWFYLVSSAFGEVLYDPEPSILYRQHGSNVVGGSNSILSKLKNKFNSFRKHAGKRLLYQQALEFKKNYGEQLTGDKKEQLDMFLNPRSTLFDRISYLNQSKLFRQSRLENILFKFLVLVKYI